MNHEHENELALKVEGLRKEYMLGAIGGKTLTQELNSWWAKVRHKADPNAKIGTDVALYNTKFNALEDVSFEVKKGTKLGVIGTNGAGKSTLLKILSQITAPTEGKVYINGKIGSLLEVGTGFHPEMTGRENAYLNGAILGMTKAEVDRKIDSIIEFSEVGKFIDTPVKRYSSGMYVRLAFAVAAHLDPDILIVDEVLAVGDYQFQQKCLGKMEDISKGGGRTVLFVSHQLSMIRQLCDKCLLLDHGHVVAYGDVNEVINQYLAMRADLPVVAHVDYPQNDNEYGQIYRITLKNADGETAGNFEVFDDMYLEVEYELRRNLAGVAIGMLISGAQGAIFHGFDTDTDKEKLEMREAGRYVARAKIPGILKAGKYNITISLCRPSLDGIDPKKDALTFYVDEKSVDTSMAGYASRRIGTVAVLPDWQEERMEH